MNRWRLALLAWYVIASVVTFIAFVIDKRAAERGEWRIRERTLHLIELLGGWPGAWIALSVVRHKRRKLSYVAVVVAISALHAAAILWVLLRAASCET